MVLNSMMNSPAWLDLSGNAVKLLLHLMKLSQGNNGWGHKDEPSELYLAEREAAQAIGVSRNTVSRAFEQLIDHGFLRVVRLGHFKVKLKIATVWRLTFQPYPQRHQGPSNEWRDWRPDQNSRAQNLNATGARRAHRSSQQVDTDAKSDPERIEIRRKPARPGGPIFAPHIDLPRGCDPSERGAGWWGADLAFRARTSARLAMLAWIAPYPMPVAA